MKNKKTKKLVLFSIILLITGIYTSFLSIDIISGYSYSKYSKIIKYMSILLCCVITFMIGEDGHNTRSTRLLQSALVFTAIADYFMHLMGMFEIGIGIFVIVQIFHIVRNSINIQFNKMEVITAIIVYFIVAIILLFIGKSMIPKGKGILFIAICFYGITLGTSLWMSIGTLWRKYFPGTTAIMISLGKTFFFFCDINVGLTKVLPSNAQLNGEHKMIKFTNEIKIAQKVKSIKQNKLYVVSKKIKVPFILKSISSILIWFFYLPAQVLLAISGYKNEFLKLE